MFKKSTYYAAVRKSDGMVACVGSKTIALRYVRDHRPDFTLYSGGGFTVGEVCERYVRSRAVAELIERMPMGVARLA